MTRERYVLTLGTPLGEALEEIAKAEGVSTAEIIRRGLAFYAAVRSHADPGQDRVVIRSHDGTEREVILI